MTEKNSKQIWLFGLALAVACCALGFFYFNLQDKQVVGEAVKVVPKGLLDLESLKLGIPESAIEDAVLTFVIDESPAARAGGKHQYLSRTKDSDGGQYAMQCLDGKNFMIDVIYTTPVDLEIAAKTMRRMLPPLPKDLPQGSESINMNVKTKLMTYTFTPELFGQLTLAEDTLTKVNHVSVWKQDVKKQTD